MNEVLPKIVHLLNQHTLSAAVVENIVKSLFYGLWNFDKMVNQHALSTNIADILNKIPKKNAFFFLQSILNFLS
jgi:DICT domain-containing protein